MFGVGPGRREGSDYWAEGERTPTHGEAVTQIGLSRVREPSCREWRELLALHVLKLNDTVRLEDFHVDYVT